VSKAAQLEAENLAKALAVAQSGSNNTVAGTSGGMSAGGDAAKSNALRSLSSNAQDSQSKEKLTVQHALAHSVATSSSAAVATMVGDVKASMQPSIPSINTGTSNQPIFDLQMERQRRQILEMIWLRSKEDELEEAELVKELKAIETQIRKLKKSGRHIVAAAAASSTTATTTTNANNSQPLGANSNAARSTPASSQGTSPVPPPSFGATTVGKDTTKASYSMLHAQFASTAPTPTPGTPYLQSGRLVQPATGGHLSINKTTLKRMEQVLKELNIMERPIPTKRVCDMYDHVRKGVLTLLTLQKVMLKKESEVVSRRVKLEKIAGNAVARDLVTKNAAAVASVVTTANLASSSSISSLNMKGKGGSTVSGVVGGGGGGVTNTPKSSSGGSKKTGGGKGKGSKKKSGDGSKSGTKRKSSSKKAAAAAAVFTNNAEVLSSGGIALVGSGSAAPLTAMATGTPIGALGTAKSAQIHASSKIIPKAGDTFDTGGKQNKKRARKN